MIEQLAVQQAEQEDIVLACLQRPGPAFLDTKFSSVNHREPMMRTAVRFYAVNQVMIMVGTAFILSSATTGKTGVGPGEGRGAGEGCVGVE